VKVTISFVEKLIKEPSYLEFHKEVDLKQQELQKSKPTGKEEQINAIEVGEDTLQVEIKQVKKEVAENSRSSTKSLKNTKFIC
jgi:hypothetical protein